MGDILSDRVGLLLSEGLIVDDAVIELVGVADPAVRRTEPVGVTVGDTVGLGDRDPVGLTDSVGVTVGDTVGLGDKDPVGLTDSVGVTVGLAELVGVREPDTLGDRDPVGLADIDPVADIGTSAYEIENTGPPPPSAIGTAVGKTIVKVEFC